MRTHPNQRPPLFRVGRHYCQQQVLGRTTNNSIHPHFLILDDISADAKKCAVAPVTGVWGTRFLKTYGPASEGGGSLKSTPPFFDFLGQMQKMKLGYGLCWNLKSRNVICF